ncbi:MAG: FCD domain-containing protein, partial [Christensenellales bacterium]
FASLSADEPERLIASLEEHKKIYMEISKGDAENAEKYMREHIRSVKAFQIRKNLLINN